MLDATSWLPYCQVTEVIAEAERGKSSSLHFVAFDLSRIDDIPELVRKLRKDFGPIYERLASLPDLGIETIQPTDRMFARGDQAYARTGGRLSAS